MTETRTETREVEPPPAQRVDPFLYRMVVLALALALVLMVLGGLVLAFFDKEVPAALIALGAASGGALGGLLAPSPVK